MEDFIKKLEQLRDLAKALAPKKPGESSLVPALKLPSPKPLSMPSVSATPTKLPGASPASTKDPKAMAAQLKNPRPKKPKIEMLKTAANGQWSIEKDESGTMMPDGDC